MCDTIGRRIGENHSIFAKNSDRSPNEPQIIEFIEHKKHTEDKLRCTYISIDQVEETNAMVISRPVWLWGAEMGVNEHGVCIGNEAVFTKGKYGPDSLIGMDYVRLGLERGNTAYEAVCVINGLLERYGQGGNCGYDKDFRYDNSYLIMDRKEIYVLETADREWAYKKYEHASISNRLTLGDDCDAYSSEPCDFKKEHSDFLYSTFSAAAGRRKMTCSCKLDSVYDAFAALRQHTVKDPMCRASVSSVCMHAGDMFADQTTSSMVVELTDDIKIYVTGCSRPCLAVFKPYDFCAGGIIFPEGTKNADAYWKRAELHQRQLIGMTIPVEYNADRDALERILIKDPSIDALAFENALFEKWEDHPYEEGKPSRSFLRYWEKKNGKLMR
ncbi:MAG: hypothetical protein IKA24_02485 [Mogibacterium sp.]|nr:hypothetical protein [Mogibacterium sp.]